MCSETLGGWIGVTVSDSVSRTGLLPDFAACTRKVRVGSDVLAVNVYAPLLVVLPDLYFVQVASRRCSSTDRLPLTPRFPLIVKVWPAIGGDGLAVGAGAKPPPHRHRHRHRQGSS